MTKTNLRYRQIHMDFHTGKDIPGIGAEFDPDEFAQVLDQARVNSVTCFARGHHGWLYYDSQEFPERIHPNLADKNFLKKQIEACHERDINVPIYITVQWDLYTAKKHPEWRIVSEKGELTGTPPYQAGFYQFLCVNTPYGDFLKKQTAEVMDKLPVDGLFFDIVQVKDCSCFHCQQDMKKNGYNPAKKADRLEFAKKMLDDFKLEMTDFVQQKQPGCTVFYNAGHIGPSVRESQQAYTHFELESLPSGGWGYMHFPVSVRFARNLGLECMGMTGKFHTSWGDFHSFKTKEALAYECFQMLAFNARCSIGDQLPPSGKISKPVYDLVGKVYQEVEKKEPWCKGATALTEIAVFSPEEFTGERVPVAAAGAVSILQQGGHQFDIVDSNSSFDDYRLLILPDVITVDDKLAAKLTDYIDKGGKIIASFKSGLNTDRKDFGLKELGINLQKEQTLADDGKPVAGRNYHGNDYAEYLLTENEIGEGLPDTEHVMYMKGLEINANENTQVLANVISSYFNRTWEHFCSHRQTPSSGQIDYPGIVQNGNCIYFAHPIFTQYNKNAPVWCKKLMLNAVNILMGAPLLEHDGPSTVITTLNEQKEKNRLIVHLLNYIPQRKSQDIDIIEDVIPLYDINLSIKTDKDVEKVSLVPDANQLSFQKKDNRVDFTIDKLEGHQMVELKLK